MEKDGGCVLLSTRDLHVSKEVDMSNIVNFNERDDAVGEEMLCKYAEVRKDWIDGATQCVKDAVKDVVRRCGGLPVALGVAGKGIRSIARRRSGGGGEEKERSLGAIVKCSEKLEGSLFDQMDLGKNGYGVHGGLFGSLKISLEHGSEWQKREEDRHEWCIEELHRGLCVLQKQAWAPVIMLSCL